MIVGLVGEAVVIAEDIRPLIPRLFLSPDNSSTTPLCPLSTAKDRCVHPRSSARSMSTSSTQEASPSNFTTSVPHLPQEMIEASGSLHPVDRGLCPRLLEAVSQCILTPTWG